MPTEVPLKEFTAGAPAFSLEDMSADISTSSSRRSTARTDSWTIARAGDGRKKGCCRAVGGHFRSGC